jgi:hypothetical protein
MLSTFRTAHGLPGFKIAVNGAWTLTAGDRVVARGNGAGVVVDAAATGAGDTYTLTAGGLVKTVNAARAKLPSLHMIALENLSHVTGVTMQGADKNSLDAGANLFYPAGRRTPVVRVTGYPHESLAFEFTTTGRETEETRAIMAAGLPVWLWHDVENCPLPACDIPPARLTHIQTVDEERADRRDKAFRRWHVNAVMADMSGAGNRTPPLTYRVAREHGFTFNSGSYMDMLGALNA